MEKVRKELLVTGQECVWRAIWLITKVNDIDPNPKAKKKRTWHKDAKFPALICPV